MSVITDDMRKILCDAVLASADGDYITEYDVERGLSVIAPLIEAAVRAECAAELSRLREMTTWRPIETAPKDGTESGYLKLVFDIRAVRKFVG